MKMYRQQTTAMCGVFKYLILHFCTSKNLKLSYQNVQNYHGPRLSKRRNSSPLNVFLSESGVSKCKEFGWIGTICLIWRTRCSFKALEFGRVGLTLQQSADDRIK